MSRAFRWSAKTKGGDVCSTSSSPMSWYPPIRNSMLLKYLQRHLAGAKSKPMGPRPAGCRGSACAAIQGLETGRATREKHRHQFKDFRDLDGRERCRHGRLGRAGSGRRQDYSEVLRDRRNRFDQPHSRSVSTPIQGRCMIDGAVLSTSESFCDRRGDHWFDRQSQHTNPFFVKMREDVQARGASGDRGAARLRSCMARPGWPAIDCGGVTCS